MKLHRRINRAAYSRLSPKRKAHARFNVALWAVFILAAILLPVWAGNEGQRLLAEYQASPVCASNNFTVAPQNCRMMITIWVSDISADSSTVDRGNLLDTMHFKAVLPNGEVRTLNVYVTQYSASELDNSELDPLFVSRFLLLGTGKSVQAEYWQGRVTNITAQLPGLYMPDFMVTFRTTDHPVYNPEVIPSKTLSILGLLLISLILWTVYDLLRR